MRSVFISHVRRRRRRWLFVLGSLLVVAGLGVVGYLTLLRAPADVFNPSVEFKADDSASPAPAVRRPGKGFRWPIYGLTPGRTRYMPAEIGPPFRRVWKAGGSKLIEFQPVIARRTLFVVKNNGEATAISTKRGTVKWRERIGSLNASSPAWWRDRLFVATLSKRLVALDAKRGRILWRVKLPSRSESSPLVLDARVYFGSEDGTVYALRARDGRRIWTYRAQGAVKGALAYSKGLLHFGDYAGDVTALRARDGSLAWRRKISGRSFGRAGRFYSTPAVAFGRVYVGNTDGKVYSFSARTGRLAWTKSTGGYVYAAPAVADVPGTRPTVYIGSYGGSFYALDARTGGTLWTHRAGGVISGAATVVGRVVYFSNLTAKSTTGLDVKTGRRVFKFGRGAFNPVISDWKRIYLTGYSSLYAFEPKRHQTVEP